MDDDAGLFGPLFTTDAMRACFSDAARLRAMLDAEIALARAAAAAGLVPEGLADAVMRASLPDAGAIGRATALSGVPTIPFVTAIQRQLPPELERGFHKGATTQDIMDTALVLQMRAGFGLLAAEIGAVLDGLMIMAARYRDTPCVGRTYGQHAAPITFGFKAAVWLVGVADAAAALAAVRSRVLVASLGGPVGTLAGLGDAGPAVLEGYAAALGLGPTPIAWHTLRGRMVEAGCWLATLIGALAKMATDIAHLASTEVAEVAEPHVPGRGGSSAMPHKRNPVSCTVILAAHAAAPGHVTTLLTAMAAAHERPPGLWHAEWQALPALFCLAAGALREARALAEGLEVDAPRMLETIGQTQGLLFADRAAALLTPVLGREAAHERVAHAAAEVRRTGSSLDTVLGPGCAAAFDLAPGIRAAGPWVDRAMAHAKAIRAGF